MWFFAMSQEQTYPLYTALKSDSKCSFINHKLRFIAGFCLVLPALMTFFNTLVNGE